MVLKQPAYLKMLIGHGLFILSGIFYSAAWILNGNKDFMAGYPEKLFFILSFFCGLGAVSLIALSIGELSLLINESPLKVRYFLTGGFIFSIVTYLIITYLFKREPTSEIFIIMIWTVLETCAVLVLSQNGWLSFRQTLISGILVFLCTAVSLVCYTIHYILQVKERFINGLVPYFTVSLCMLIIGVFMIISED